MMGLRRVGENVRPFAGLPFFRTRHSLPHRARRRAQAERISYIHAEGYPAGEMKHGPNALIDENLPVVIHCHARREQPAVDDPLRKNDVEP